MVFCDQHMPWLQEKISWKHNNAHNVVLYEVIIDHEGLGNDEVLVIRIFTCMQE